MIKRTIQDNDTIRKLIQSQMYKSNMRNIDVVNEAHHFGYPSIEPRKLSLYFNANDSSRMTEADVFYLCTRFAINVRLEIVTEQVRNTRTLQRRAQRFIKALKEGTAKVKEVPQRIVPETNIFD